MMKRYISPIFLLVFLACSSNSEREGFERILKEHNGVFSKHGWNHYGPGYFELDKETGVLSSYGGMGLFWYSVSKYKDFVLELEYRCSESKTNSGVFVRVPEVPSSDEYIYHSFEVQIADAGEGIHKTAAVCMMRNHHLMMLQNQPVNGITTGSLSWESEFRWNLTVRRLWSGKQSRGAK